MRVACQLVPLWDSEQQMWSIGQLSHGWGLGQTYKTTALSPELWSLLGTDILVVHGGREPTLLTGQGL